MLLLTNVNGIVKLYPKNNRIFSHIIVFKRITKGFWNNFDNTWKFNKYYKASHVAIRKNVLLSVTFI